jgi:predicted esterase
MSTLTHEHVYVPSATGSARTLLLLHGTGGDERSLLGLGRQLAPDAALLGVRGRVLEHGAPRWFRRFGEGVFDEADVRQRAGELAQFLAAAQVQYGFDPAGLASVGYSNGANIAAALILLHPGVLAAAVLLRAMLPLEPDTAPRLAGTRVLMAAGERDPYAPAESVQRLSALLRGGGAEVELRWSPGGHQLGLEEVAAAQRWLAALSAGPGAG